MAEPTPTPDLDALLGLAIAAATDAGGLLAVSVGTARTDVGTKSTGTDMVTEMDRAAERRIVELLREHRPDDAILGEEGGAHHGASRIRWVIDPLDGTTNYLYGLPAYAVSIAAEADGEVVVGVVHDPSHGELFTAVRGGGAYRNGQRLTVAGPPTLATALVGTGFAYDAARRSWQALVLSRLIDRVRDVRRVGAAALDLCWVACGRLDAFYERGLQPWDFAAGGLIAAEAGASVGAIGDGTPPDDGVLAAPAHLAGELRLLLRAAESAASASPSVIGPG